MRRLRCLFRKHQWGSSYDPETEKTWWNCRRCGKQRVTSEDLMNNGGMFWGLGG